MVEQLVVQSVWVVVATGLAILAIRRSANHVRAVEEERHRAMMDEWRQMAAASEARDAARQAAYVAEQAALDAETAGRR